ncbi:uncharacterized protein LOC114533041 [Dendronephthya gigantea]|uniref:uncharacterized protein LOC114533041 n=1 Tax=Dendronephthya gigantea TaxID=151771 RepID=UPI00106A3872|nr:uncharacterized protein LOC114533041 [Dendronephthya gigantea]
MNYNPLETMDRNNNDFGIISNNEGEIFDKVMMSAENEDDCNYLNLIAECISEISQAESNEKNCSVEVISETCEVHKYYQQTADATVENHFTRSLATEELNMSTDASKKELPVKKTGASKRKARRKPTVTSLMPSRPQVTKHARVEHTMVQPMPPVQPIRPAEPMRPVVVQPYTLMHPVCGKHASPAIEWTVARRII